MKVKVDVEWTVGKLTELKRNNFLRVNHEYQRGERWTPAQKQMFIDSIFRGYSIPAFYFHKHEASVGDITNTFYDIVDGQQRVNAIYDYSEGAFPLLAPSGPSGFRFPNFVKDAPCPWGGKLFDELSEELKDKLRSHKVVVYEMETGNENAIRDLFIRLQGGTPLTPQDKRDAWPGNFTEFVLRVGGKTGVAKWRGDPLFQEIPQGSESRRRQLAAQVFMLFWTLHKEKKFCDINSANIDRFYHSQVGFDENSDEARRFKEVCEKLHRALTLHGTRRLAGHHLIHLFLLVDSLLGEYVEGTWESRLAGKLHEFDARCREAVKAEKERQDTEYPAYYTEYAQLTQTSADQAPTIRRRHAFFTQEMLKLLSPEQLDPRREFTDLELQAVFHRDAALCQYCKMNGGDDHPVPWEEAEAHYIRPHREGGTTSIENAALVHRDCHPRGAQAVREFRNWWERRASTARLPRRFPPPDGTKARFHYGGREFHGEIRDRMLVIDGSRYRSFSGASKAVSGGTSRNGWRAWELQLPGEEGWTLADEWRRRG